MSPNTKEGKKTKKEALEPQALMQLTAKVGVLASRLASSGGLSEVTAFLEQAKQDPLLIDLFIHTAKEIIADQTRKEPSPLDEGPSRGVISIKPDDKKLIQSNVVTFKAMLKIHVDRKGGVTWLADQLGVSVPNISRFFATDAVPRESTLVQIFKVLGIDEVKIPVGSE